MVAISQSSTATGSVPSAVYMMLPMRLSPQEMAAAGSSAGQFASIHSKARSIVGNRRPAPSQVHS